MAKVNKSEFGKRRPKLLVEDLDGGDATALTIASVEHVTTDDEEGKRNSLVITFEDTGDKVYWPNVTSIGYIIDMYGDDDDDWIGKPLPLMRHKGSFRGKVYDNLQVPDTSMWDEIISEAGLKPASRGRKVASAPVKRTTKKAGRGR